MHLRPNKLSLLMTLRSIFALVLISFLTIGGCNDNNNGNNNGGGDGLGGTETGCSTLSTPCHSVSVNENNTKFVCTFLSNDACAVDLEDVVNQVDPAGTSVNDHTIMWIEAWGGRGGFTDNGANGGPGGYAVTTTTVQGIKNKNSGSSIIYYFLGTAGLSAAERCAGGGGVATIVTTEDLLLNPDANPTQTSPPILLIAGGGGSGAAGNHKGVCLTGTTFNGGHGGIAVALFTDEDGQGAGTPSTNHAGESFGTGGNQDGMGSGGKAAGSGSTDGTSGFGGRGGVGGSGPDCGGVGADGFSNISVHLSMTTGLGGNGGSAKGSCAAGGGAGGGGYGGGGGGNHGNESIAEVGGAGGGSFAIESTQLSNKSPVDIQPNPCSDTNNGCVRITFVTN